MPSSIRRSSIFVSHARAIAAIAALILLARGASASPCCAGSGAVPAMILGDERAQIEATLAHGGVIGDAPAGDGLPVFRAESDDEWTQTFTIQGALLLSDRWQVGATLPIVRHELSRPSFSDSYTGPGDARVHVAWEAIPEYGYSSWRPKGYVFVGATLPTGRSVYEVTRSSGVDAVGLGRTTALTGAVFLKRWSSWDLFAVPVLEASLPARFEGLELGPSWGSSLTLGGGYSFEGAGEGLRLGMRVQPVYGSRFWSEFDGSPRAETAGRLQWNVGFDAAYVLGTDWSITASYNDQTLLGPALNATLSRSVALGLRHRWER